MVGARQMERVMELVKQAGAKIVLAGDIEQLQAIEAGAPLRLIIEEGGSKALSEIRRQKEGWQKQATVDLHDGDVGKALEAYSGRGFVHEHGTQKGALDSMVEAWDRHRQEHPRESQVMLAFRRADVFELNMRAREIRRNAYELGMKDVRVWTERGERIFAAGDRVCFLKNDRSLGVKNGTLGAIEIIQMDQTVIRLDGPGHKRVVLDLESYNHLDHGYAATVHKSQGATVDRAHVLASQLFDRHTTYVALSRHTGQVDLHWSKEEFSDQKALCEALSRENRKDMVVDY
jgi:ATP-dependent exoDNAse (exonuclease V) alpha subunit